MLDRIALGKDLCPPAPEGDDLPDAQLNGLLNDPLELVLLDEALSEDELEIDSDLLSTGATSSPNHWVPSLARAHRCTWPFPS